jgi:hypothetical protein
MGEARAKRDRLRDLKASGALCAFCGTEPATTIEHVPPIIMFRGKKRPKGLECPACERCNGGTSHADQVAALLGRAYGTTEGHPEAFQDIQRVMRGVANNVPGLLEEMKVGRAGQKMAKKRLPIDVDGFVVRTGGPILRRNMQMFGLKLAFMLQHELNGKPLPSGGGVAAMWYTNYQKWTGKYPQELADMMPPGRTLQQGRNEVSDQFVYSWVNTEDRTLGCFMAAFRKAFAVFGAWSVDRARLTSENPVALQTFTPSEFASMADTALAEKSGR